LNAVLSERTTLRTVVRDTRNSREISLIARRCSKNARRPNRQTPLAFDFEEEFGHPGNFSLSATIGVDRSIFNIHCNELRSS
jgi:hypothetical protein